MTKEFNVNAPLRKEMDELVEKRSSVPFASAEWVAINRRWNELLAIWANSRIDRMEEDLSRVRVT